MNSLDWNRLAIASILSCSVFIGAWGISHFVIPDTFPVHSVFAQEKHVEKLDISHANIEKGQAIASQQCGLCHTFQPDTPEKIGPSLATIQNRKIAFLAGFTYSDDLKKHQNENWTIEKLNIWIKNPREFAPATLMAYPGLSSEEDRRDVIAYLNSLSDHTKEQKNIKN